MTYNILVVDDSKIARYGVCRSLAAASLPLGNIFEACNGVEALSILREQWIDIVFSDLTMPTMGGLDLLAEMANDESLKTIPFVVVSAEQSDGTINRLRAYGAEYLRKPFRPEHFREIIQKLLGSIPASIHHG